AAVREPLHRGAAALAGRGDRGPGEPAGDAAGAGPHRASRAESGGSMRSPDVQSTQSATPAVRRPPPSLPRPNEACWCGSGEKYKRCHKEADYLFLRDEAKRLEASKVRAGV